MGVFASIKSRLPGGSRKNDYDQEYDEYYDEYEEDSYDDEDSDSQNWNYDASRGSSGRSYAAGARNYRNDEHAPLISMTDVRSQELLPYETQDQASGRREYRASSSVNARTSELSMHQGPGSYTSPYVDDSPSQSAQVLNSPSAQTLAGIHEERRRLEGGTHRSSSQKASSRFADRSNGHADRVSATPTHERSGMSAADIADASPPYYASRSGVATTRGAATPHHSLSASSGLGVSGLGSSGSVRPSVSAPASPSLSASPLRQVAILRPTSYSDAEQVAVALKSGSAVVVDLSHVRAELGKRILDFSFGVAAALGAQVESPANRVYAITKAYALTNEERELLGARGLAL